RGRPDARAREDPRRGGGTRLVHGERVLEVGGAGGPPAAPRALGAAQAVSGASVRGASGTEADFRRSSISGSLPDGSASSTLMIWFIRSEEHTSELQSRGHLVCRLLLEKKKIYAEGGTFRDCRSILSSLFSGK